MSAEPLQAKARKFPCERCGADVQWNPGAAALKCGHCGNEKQVAASAGTVTEKSVDAGLRAPRDLGWGAERKVVACKRCGAHTTLDPHVAATTCAFCGTAAIVEAPPNPNVIRPEGLLPFRIPKQTAMQTFGDWLGRLWFRPNNLKSEARITQIQGAYVPFWTFDAATHSNWTADSGTYYYTQSRDAQGRVRRQRHVRWTPASGFVEMFFDDVPVPASRGIEPSLTQGIEPFPTAELTPYDPSYLSGFLAEENAVDLPEALDAAKSRMMAEVRIACGRRVPGDTYRNLQVQTVFSALAYKNALLPIWIAAFEYRGQPYRFLVNGVTGAAHGSAPWSWVKITIAVIAGLIAAIAFLAVYSQ